MELTKVRLPFTTKKIEVRGYTIQGTEEGAIIMMFKGTPIKNEAVLEQIVALFEATLDNLQIEEVT